MSLIPTFSSRDRERISLFRSILRIFALGGLNSTQQYEFSCLDLWLTQQSTWWYVPGWSRIPQ